MRLSEAYTHLNGLEYLLVHKPELWKEIRSVISEVNAKQCPMEAAQGKSLTESLLFSPVDLNASFIRLLREKSWQKSMQSYLISRNENFALRRFTCRRKERACQWILTQKCQHSVTIRQILSKIVLQSRCSLENVDLWSAIFLPIHSLFMLGIALMLESRYCR